MLSRVSFKQPGLELPVQGVLLERCKQHSVAAGIAAGASSEWISTVESVTGAFKPNAQAFPASSSSIISTSNSQEGPRRSSSRMKYLILEKSIRGSKKKSPSPSIGRVETQIFLPLSLSLNTDCESGIIRSNRRKQQNL